MFENKQSKKFNTYTKKILKPDSTITIEINSQELNFLIKNSTKKLRFIILELNEAVDENDNTTTSIEQFTYTNLLKMGK